MLGAVEIRLLVDNNHFSIGRRDFETTCGDWGNRLRGVRRPGLSVSRFAFRSWSIHLKHPTLLIILRGSKSEFRLGPILSDG